MILSRTLLRAQRDLHHNTSRPSMRRLLPTLLRRRLSSTITAPSWALPLPEGVLGTVTELLATTGSRIHLDEVVAIIETDKLAVDVKAQNAGVVKSILVSVGDEVKVRQPLYALDVHAAPPPIDSEQHLAERMWARDREVRLEEERQQAERAWQEHRKRERERERSGEPSEWQWRGASWQQSARPRQTSSGGESFRFHHQHQQRQHRRPKRRSTPTQHRLQPNEVSSLPVSDLMSRVLAHAGGCPYACLGLPTNAAASSVRSRYLALALRLHPDKAGSGQPRAKEAFAAIDGAFRTLKRR